MGLYCVSPYSSQDKSKWEKAAAEDKKRYEKEMAAYKGGASPAKKAAKKTAKK